MSGTRRRIFALLAIAAIAFGAFAVLWFGRPVAPPADTRRLELAESTAAGNGGRARELLRELLASHPDDPELLIYRARFLHEEGDPEAALELLESIPDHPPAVGFQARLQAAEIQLQIDRARAAEAQFQRAAALTTHDLRPAEALVEMYSLELRREETHAAFERLRTLRPLPARLEAVDLLAGQPVGDEIDRMDDIRDRLRADPQDVISRMGLARYLMFFSENSEARVRIAPAFQEHPDDEELRALLGLSCLAAGDRDEAARLVQEHPEWRTQPLSELQLRFFSRLCLADQQWEPAARYLRALIQQVPDDVEAHANLGRALSRSGAEVDAEAAFEQSRRLDRIEHLARQVLSGLPDEPPPPEIVSEIATLAAECGLTGVAERWSRLANRKPAVSSPPGVILTAARVPSEVGAGDVASESVAGPPEYLLGLSTPPEPTQDSGFDVGAMVRFDDVAGDAGLEFQYFNGGSGRRLIVETIGGGVAVLDYDSDGRPDLYFPQGADLQSGQPDPALSDRLFRNLGRDRFQDVTEAAGLGDLLHSLGCATADFDNDGDPDLFVANLGPSVLYRNNGDGTFTPVTPDVISAFDDCSTAAAFGDFDGDGQLDLYVVKYVADWRRVCRNTAGDIVPCEPTLFPGVQDRLYRNDGQGGWQDVTESAGLVQPGGKGLGLMVSDFDGDAKSDLFVANDGTPNYLFRNASTPGEIRFEEIGFSAGAAVAADGRARAGMGIACADFDANGCLDLLVTNFHRETNTFYANLGGGLFEDRTCRSGIDVFSRDMLGFGAQPLDADRDGDPDLVVANGHIGDHPGTNGPWRMPAQAFANDGAGRLFDQGTSGWGSYFEQRALGRGMARLDQNGDGWDDLVIVHHDRPAVLLTNHSERFRAPRKDVVRLKLIGRESNRDAIGAVVRVTLKGVTRAWAVPAGDGYACSNERVLTLGAPSRLEEIEIVWPTGERERSGPLLPGAVVDHVEGGPWLVRPW